METTVSNEMSEVITEPRKKEDDEGITLTSLKEPSLSKVYICYINRYFLKKEVYAVFDDYDKAQQWVVDINKKIKQIEGMEHAAETRYKDKDPAKYKQVLGEAERFRAKAKIPEGAWLAALEGFEINVPKPLTLYYKIE